MGAALTDLPALERLLQDDAAATKAAIERADAIQNQADLRIREQQSLRRLRQRGVIPERPTPTPRARLTAPPPTAAPPASAPLTPGRRPPPPRSAPPAAPPRAGLPPRPPAPRGLPAAGAGMLAGALLTALPYEWNRIQRFTQDPAQYWQDEQNAARQYFGLAPLPPPRRETQPRPPAPPTLNPPPTPRSPRAQLPQVPGGAYYLVEGWVRAEGRRDRQPAEPFQQYWGVQIGGPLRDIEIREVAGNWEIHLVGTNLDTGQPDRQFIAGLLQYDLDNPQLLGYLQPTAWIARIVDLSGNVRYENPTPNEPDQRLTLDRPPAPAPTAPYAPPALAPYTPPGVLPPSRLAPPAPPPPRDDPGDPPPDDERLIVPPGAAPYPFPLPVGMPTGGRGGPAPFSPPGPAPPGAVPPGALGTGNPGRLGNRAPAPAPQPGGGTAPAPAPPPTAPPVPFCRYFPNLDQQILANSNTTNTRLEQANAVLTFASNVQLANVDAKLGPQLPNGGLSGALQKTGALVTKTWNFLQIDRVLNFLTYITTLHNAYMLSNNIAQTLFGAIDNVLNFLGLEDADGSPISVGETVSRWTESFFKRLIGEEKVEGIKAAWAQYNRIYQSAMNIVYTVSSIIDSTRSIIEVSAEYTGKIGNALKRGGVVFETAYGWMQEKFDQMSVGNNRWEKLFTKLDRVDTVTSSMSMVTSDAVSIKDSIRELTEQRDEFKEALEDIGFGDSPSSTPITETERSSKRDSQAPTTLSDPKAGGANE